MKKTLIALALGMSFLVTGCGEDKVKDEAVEFSKTVVKKKLADPESVTFSEMKFVNLNAEKTMNFGEYIVCGKVSGKDARGEDMKNEFAVDLVIEKEKIGDKSKDFMNDIYPRYDFATGLVNREYYNYEIACSKGVEAFMKKRDEK